MSEIPLPHTAETPTLAEPTPTAGGVPTLRQAREAAGLHVVALAAMLKVPVSKLEALEAGRYSELPDLTFARALAKSVCRQLKIDPAPILAGLPQSAPLPLNMVPQGLNAAMPSASGKGVTTALVGRHLPVPAVVAVLLVVLAAVLWWFVPQGGHPSPEATHAPNAPVALVVETAPAEPGAPTPTPVSEPSAPSLSPAPTTGPVPATPAQTAGAGGVAVPAPLPAPVPKPVAEASAAVTAGDGQPVLQLHATQTAWVEVVGRSGRLLIQRTLQPGETVAFLEDAPYAVVTGRADATEVSVRGQPLDLGPVARNNVARFEVK